MSDIDAHVGAKIKARRMALRISPANLAFSLNISVADLELYESDRRRLCVSQLFDLANNLNVRMAYFFGDLSFPDEASFAPRRQSA